MGVCGACRIRLAFVMMLPDCVLPMQGCGRCWPSVRRRSRNCVPRWRSLTGCAAALGVYLWHGQFLSRDRACAAMADMFGCTPSPGALATMAKKTAGAIAPALDAIITALIEPEVAHFDETGFRVAGKLAWVHSASFGKFVLVTVHARRGGKA